MPIDKALPHARMDQVGRPEAPPDYRQAQEVVIEALKRAKYVGLDSPGALADLILRDLLAAGVPIPKPPKTDYERLAEKEPRPREVPSHGRR